MAKLTNNADPDKYSFSGYGIGFYSNSLFLIPNFNRSKNLNIFVIESSLSTHTNNSKKFILVIGKEPT